MKKPHIAHDLKNQIINRIKNDGVTVVQAAKEHGVNETTIYAWITKKIDGQPTPSEIIRLKRENEQLYKLVGEITLKLSGAQKRNETRGRYPQNTASARTWCGTEYTVLSTKTIEQGLATEVSG